VIQKALPIILFFLSTLPMTGFSQSSGQATMRVSVRVVSATSIETVQPSLVNLSERNVSTLGGIKLEGVDARSTLISTDKNVILKGAGGEKIHLNVSRIESNKDSDSADVKFKGIVAKKTMLAGIYKGKLTTTIEYF